MSSFKSNFRFTGITDFLQSSHWPDKLKSNPILHIVAGFPEGCVLGIASFYDFINRIIKLDDRPRVKAKTRKPTGKKRLSFFTTIAATNIHLDAQLAKLGNSSTPQRNQVPARTGTSS